MKKKMKKKLKIEKKLRNFTACLKLSFKVKKSIGFLAAPKYDI